MDSPHKPDAHHAVAAATLASLAATLAAIQAHAGNAQTLPDDGPDEDDSSYGADTRQAPPMRRTMS
jgi:hypothetical protein